MRRKLDISNSKSRLYGRKSLEILNGVYLLDIREEYRFIN